MLAGAARIEELCFSVPWSEKSLEILLGEQGVGFAVVEDSQVAAYGGMLTVLDEGQITNIAVSPDYRRKGFARAILSALEEYAKDNGIEFLTLEVRESNSAARALYLSEGWKEDGIRKNFYKFPPENAILMSKSLRT